MAIKLPRAFVATVLITMAGCGQQTQLPTSTVVQRPAEDARAGDQLPGDSRGLVPTTCTTLGPGVYLETTRDVAESIVNLVGAAFAQVGGVAGGGGIEAACVQQPIAWQGADGLAPRRVLVPGVVICRTGFIEHFLSNGWKAHESIVVADVDARFIHFGLVACGAQPGRPVQYFNEKGDEEYRPASGDKIRVLVQYVDPASKRLVTVPAQKWIRDAKTRKELAYDWVFAGSTFYVDPSGKPQYSANEGRFVCVSNFVNAMLDLPIRSLDADPQSGLDFEANTEAIPPRETKVTVILEPLGKT